ncbi:MAG: hypothetical protein H0V70_22485 [Ktedonobacteraceae bacterium]|nr:hypothetical protein [Ktedonobacteraceae bacterium]
MLGEDWVEGISASPKASQNHNNSPSTNNLAHGHPWRLLSACFEYIGRILDQDLGYVLETIPKRGLIFTNQKTYPTLVQF